MIDALITGKLIKDTELKTGQSGKPFCQFMLSVPLHNEPDNVIVSCMAFGEVAQRIAKMGKGDPLAAIGNLKPTE